MKFETTFQTEPKQDSLKEVRWCEKGIFNVDKKNWYKKMFYKKIETKSNWDKRPNSKVKAKTF